MNILAVGAHFDDIELGCGGSIAKHIKNGDNVFYYVATTSGFNNINNHTVRDNNIALKEGKAAADFMGSHLICGGFETLKLEFTDDLNYQLVKIIEEKKIDLIYTHWRYDVHHDHIALSKASLHSGRHVNKILMYRSNWYDSDIQFHKNFYVDITLEWEKKVEAIKLHLSEYERMGKKWIEYLENEAKNDGMKINTKYAESFECVKWSI